MVCVDGDERSTPGRFYREGRDQKHGRSLLPDAGARGDRPRQIQRPASEERGADPVAAAAGWSMVDALRGEAARSGVSNRARIVGIASGGRAGDEPTSEEGHRLSAREAADLRWLDGPAAVVREF